MRLFAIISINNVNYYKNKLNTKNDQFSVQSNKS